jgi:uncharacterized protein (DUF488 family)
LGFRNYADYMNTSPFRTAVDHLTLLTDLGPTCFMCAETVPQRCHRLLLADYLWAQGIKVIHILDHSRTIVHELSRLATITGGRVIYNRPEPQQMELKPND